ncbi:MAG: ferrous iron transport protein B [Erysipelotrichaceae bacterium]
MIFALAGNQNSGKTTLFNQLTGSNQHVGNFPGVTVDSKQGYIRGHEGIQVVDLPGIYSISPYTNEEIVTRDFLIKNKPDGIINIIDANNIERNLYLSMQLIELEIPMIIAVNMMDEVRKNGGTIHIKQLQEELGVPIVPISASKNEGIDELIERAIDMVAHHKQPNRLDFCRGPIHRTIHATAHLIEDHAQRIGIPPRFAASKLVEGDQVMLASLKLSENEIDMIEHGVHEMEIELDTDRKAAMADMRYTFIEHLCGSAVTRIGESKEHLRSIKIDELLTHKYLAIPIFISIMLLIFYLTFSVFGAFFSDLLAQVISVFTDFVDAGLTTYGINPVVHSLVIDGVFAGVGSVLSFVPTIIVLFFFLSLLEDSGYMARVAFVMDKCLRKIGLSGRSFVPMIIGFGCSVPAIMATRTLASDRDRKMTILLTPFMSCSAKLPIYGIFTMAFFPKYRGLVMISLYLMGMLVAIISGLLFKKTVYRGKPVPFVMELPNYRMPSAKSVVLLLWDKAKDFITRAFTIIFVATIIIWFLQTFDMRFNVVSDSSNSMLADLGRLIAPVLAPLGFGDWRSATALITGFTAKEAVISTFGVLMQTSTALLPSALHTIFTPLTAMTFLVFTLLYTPCVAAVSAIKREMNSGLLALLVIFYQSAVAWIVSFVFYRIGLLVISL